MGNDTATILEQYRYDAFGMPTFKDAGGINLGTQASAIGNRFLFTGREYNSQFGFYEYRARAYHPGLGRFMSEDPKGFDAGDYNWYRYCDNDPWDETDPMGLQDQKQVLPTATPPPRERRVTAFNLSDWTGLLRLVPRARNNGQLEHMEQRMADDFSYRV